MAEELETLVFNPDQFKFGLNWNGMVANKYIPIEHILSAFDHQIGQLIFGKSLEILLFITKYPGELIKWEQTCILNHRLIYCYYVHKFQMKEI